jgi:nitroreductase
MPGAGEFDNDVMRAIMTRRSVRAYEPKKVSRDILNAIIEAGNNAPSAMNSQPWRFVVVENEELHQKMTDTAIPNAKRLLEHFKTSSPERYQQIMKRYTELKDPIYYSAPAIIFVIGRGPYADLSCPLACENMMLAAFSLGLGSCWVQFGSLITDREDIKEALDLKDDDRIFGPIIIGYPKDIPEPPDKKSPEIKWL